MEVGWLEKKKKKNEMHGDVPISDKLMLDTFLC